MIKEGKVLLLLKYRKRRIADIHASGGVRTMPSIVEEEVLLWRRRFDIIVNNDNVCNTHVK